MRLRINPLYFLVRVVAILVVTYLVWGSVAPYYVQVLAKLTQFGIYLTELSTDPMWNAATTVLPRGTNVFYFHKGFAAFRPPLDPQGIPADWVMANIVLLTALMLATPAPTWRAKAIRCLLALVIVLFLQVVDILVAIKVTYTQVFASHWGSWSRKSYQFLDAFFQSYDTLLFPFAIWAGVHLKELIHLPAAAAESASSDRIVEPVRSEKRRTGRTKRKG